MKYQELDIAGLTAMELSALIQPGDMLTIRGPGTSDTAVRIVNEGGRIYSFMATVVIDVDRLTGLAFVKITKVERPIPEVELPTEPGYYEAAGLPMSRGYNPYELRSNGHWYSNSCKVTETRMRQVAPLTRLVPETETTPATLADRIDVAKLGGRMRSLFHRDGVWADDAASLIAAIDAGELDK